MIIIETLSNDQIDVAKIVHFQQQIFNCSMEEAWEKYLHPATRNAHSHKKDEIIKYSKALIITTKPASRPTKKVIKVQVAKISGYKIECEQHRKDAFKLRIYKQSTGKDKQETLIYEHHNLLRRVYARQIIRKELNVRCANLYWEHYEKEKE